MTDRLVRERGTDETQQRQTRHFSAYHDKPNIVLLGDPGAGKSHLFKYFAQRRGARYLGVRDFLNLLDSDFSADTTLFIDGLDEQRSSRGDHGIINEIVKKLQRINPRQVRISCRAADWLGTTDLSAFKICFDRSGGCSVLLLEPLNDEERLDVLRSKGHPQPETFLQEARQRSLDELISNPQTLIMLKDVVDKHGWPANRSDLYKTSIELLLTEHNDLHKESERSHYTHRDLYEAAGAFCAGRLLAGIAGISLKPTTDNEEIPSYTEFPETDRKKALAALNRRLFVAGPVQDSVDYCHRTVAEYLAASWLSTRVDRGLSLGRLLSLICVDGIPASELRGLYAWLPVTLPQHAPALIAGDPYIVLAYGDASALGPTSRSILFSELVKLTNSDPWFRYSDQSSHSVAGLSGPDMEEGFRSILTDTTCTFSLRTLVLDALSSGMPIPSLQPALVDIVRDANAVYAERCAGIDALLNIGAAGVAAAAAAVRQIEASAQGIRLKAQGLTDIGHPLCGPSDLVALMREVAQCEEDLIGGALWHLDRIVPDAALTDALDSLDTAIVESKIDKAADSNDYELIHVVDSLLIRRLHLAEPIPPQDLERWLLLRPRCYSNMHPDSQSALGVALRSKADTLKAFVRHRLRFLPPESDAGQVIEDFRSLATGTIDCDLLIEEARGLLAIGSPERVPFLYGVALGAALRCGPSSAKAYNELLEYAYNKDELAEVRSQNAYFPLGPWRHEQTQRVRNEADNKAAQKTVWRHRFLENIDTIRNGSSRGWTASIGRVYFAEFSDIDRHLSPVDRLAATLGSDLAPIAIEGLIATVFRGEITPIKQVVEAHASGSREYWWYGLIAGLDEFYAAGHDLFSLPDDFLSSALAIGRLVPTWSHRGNQGRQMSHAWLDLILERRPDLAQTVHFVAADAELAAGGEHSNGLHALMDDERFRSIRGELAIQLLRRHTLTRIGPLQTLLKTAYHDGNHSDLLELHRSRLVEEVSGDEAVKVETIWDAVAYLMNPPAFEARLAGLSQERRIALIWAVRDLGGIFRQPGDQNESAHASQVSALIRLVGNNFQKSGVPDGSWWGDTNSWDASQWAMRMIDALSSDTSIPATQALIDLSSDESVSSYHDDIKHALATQRRRRVDLTYSRPTLQETFETLSDGSPANIADLQALVMDHLQDINKGMTGANTDSYKIFWNEDSYARAVNPKVEESCRDRLVELLRARLERIDVRVEPEGHMRDDKRVDIWVTKGDIKLVVEMKRDSHKDVWTAYSSQLDRLYARDPESSGYGIYGVFWFGMAGKGSVTTPPKPFAKPTSATQMSEQIDGLIHDAKLTKIAAFVLDVSGPARR